MPVDRQDSANLATPPKSSAGYLRVEGNRLTRVGVLSYVQPDGSLRRELRHPEDVFDPASLDSLRLVPVTYRHPSKGLSADTAQPYVRGAVGDTISHDDCFVTASIGIFDADLIKEIEAGVRELSCGYSADLESVSGEYNGEKYDTRQRNIRYNHLAVVPRGKAGPDVALRLDSAEDDKRMAMIKIKDKDVEVAQEIADLIASLQTTTAALSGERDAQKARADAAEVATLDKVKQIPALIKARTELERKASGFVAAEKMDSMDDLSIKTEVVKSVFASLDLTGKSADYVEAAYQAALASKTSKTTDQLAAVKSATHNDGVSPYEAMVARQAQAWKGKK